MRAWYAATVREFLATDPDHVVGLLATEQALRHAGDQARQISAWQDQVATLRHALADAPTEWTVALEYDLLRLEKRIDAVLLTDRAIVVLEFKSSSDFGLRDLRDTQDYAEDLHDFHALSRGHPVVPVLVAVNAADQPFVPQLIWHGVSPAPHRTNGAGLGTLLASLHRTIPEPRTKLRGTAWLDAAYQPVPTIVEAASLLFMRHSVGNIAAARADTMNLTRTTSAITRAIATARESGQRIVVFVTGVPGAGKTLCGMNIVFGEARHDGAAFLSGNAPLVAVLREALARNAAGDDRRARPPARKRTQSALQNVHRFLEDNATAPDKVPNERIIVFDEAQRAWDQAKATRGTQNKKSRLTLSEPAHTLEIMGRHQGWAVVVALIGNGQEINTGEAGLAEWGRVISSSAGWRAVAAPTVLTAKEATQRLVSVQPAWLGCDNDLDLAVPIRSVRDATTARWVEVVLDGEAADARGIASAAVTAFQITRDLGAMRAALRGLARGNRRAGLVASSGAKRLRAEGLGPQVVGPDETVTWFLERWPEDVRASDALETCATEYSCQGLELDFVGVGWGGDFIHRRGGWHAREFRATATGTRWCTVHAQADRAFVKNTYRVLLTRARYETIIWVPPGDDADPTRPRAEMDAIAEFLLACGARPLEQGRPPVSVVPPTLL
jgi:hypothetical protein